MLALLNLFTIRNRLQFFKILLFYILSTFRNNLSNNTTQNRLLITSVKIDIFTKSLEVTVHNFQHSLSTFQPFLPALFQDFTSAIGKGLVYVWKIKQSTPLPSLLHSKFGCLFFSTGSLNSSTTLHEGVGRGEALFSAFMLAKSQRGPLGKMPQLVLSPLCVVGYFRQNLLTCGSIYTLEATEELKVE